MKWEAIDDSAVEMEIYDEDEFRGLTYQSVDTYLMESKGGTLYVGNICSDYRGGFFRDDLGNIIDDQITHICKVGRRCSGKK